MKEIITKVLLLFHFQTSILYAHRDSLAIPNISVKAEAKDYEHFKLEKKFRQNFLSKTKISESDTVFVYDYSKNILNKFNVKDLNVIAYINIYGADWPYSQDDYMIGFEINKNFLKDSDEYFTKTMVYVGKENPFIQQQLKQVLWEEIESDQFPSNQISIKDTEYFDEGSYDSGQKYRYESTDLLYFLEELKADYWGTYSVFAKRLVVLDRKSDKKVNESIYYSSEGSSFADLDNQFTGKLFKNKSAVIFGFQWHSFGCPNISFLNSSEEDIYINCDNRH